MTDNQTAPVAERATAATTPFLLSPTQEAAAGAVHLWWDSLQPGYSGFIEPQPFFYLAGYAGTGKTSIARHLSEHLKPRPTAAPTPTTVPPPLRRAFAAFTGKASLVLKRKGCQPSSTIHRLIYERHFDEATKEVYFLKRSALRTPLDLIILDECSMVNEEMGKDLLSFKVPILVLGDPGQLPPIDGAGFFTSKQPDFLLTEIHRQAENSPILRAATAARNRTLLPSGQNDLGACYVLSTGVPIETLLATDQIICGTNATRHDLNRQMRAAKGFIGDLPMREEKLICLKNNWDVDGMMNGSIWRVDHIKALFGNRLRLNLASWDEPDVKVEVETHRCFFERNVPPPKGKEWRGLTHFTFGYCITCHKAQGSEWDSVVLVNEATTFHEDSAKWLYTGITRAAKQLVIAL